MVIKNRKANGVRWFACCFLVVFLVVACLNSSFSFAENTSSKRILFISSYSPSFPTFFLQIDGLKSELDDGRNVLDVEFMDTKRFPTEENLNRFYNNMKFKLAELPPYDIVIVSDDDGLNFVMKNKEELFSGIPIVFMGINNIDNAKKYSEDPLVTGVVEAASIGDTIGLAYTLNSNAQRVVALVDSTSSGQGDLISYYKLQSQYKALEFTDLDLSNMSFDEFGIALTKLTKEDIVLNLSAYVDNQGTVMTFPDSLSFILENLNQPLYHPYYHGVGDGMLGGRVISHYEQGIQAGKIAKRVLGGEDIENIPVVYESPNPYLIDYAVLTKFDLNEKLLPKDTQFINREVSVFEKYFGVIVATIIGFILQTLIIVTLVYNIHRRKLAESEILMKKAELQDANDELSVLNDEMSASNGQLIAANQELKEAFCEISDQRKHIYDILYIDTLTGMNNRLGIIELLDQLLTESSETNPFYILFMDIDNFKNINDTFGHDLGDKVLHEIGQRLRLLESERFKVGRFGGDEFLILLSSEDSVYFEDTINGVQECLKELIIVNENHFYLTTSIGVAQYPLHGQTKKELIKMADLALYEAKNSGKNKYMMFHQTMSTNVENKVKFQSLLKNAFLKKEFYLNYQPFICPESNQIMGFEALIRWNSKELGQVSPYKLITNAEEIGLISEVGNWVIEEACKFAKRINETSTKKLQVSVNISMAQLMHKNFFQDIAAVIKRLAVSPELICLEMTETIMIQSIEMGQALIQELKDFGFTVALDDFGTGYSSLSYLRSLPANILKIDQSFIKGVEDDPYNQYTLETIINLAHQLGFRIIAEGVEKSEQMEYLLRYHCDAIQGYLYSYPLSEEDAIAYILQRNSYDGE